ncbi:Hypothetical predicted protein [Mytilus galloprovincialis]|uniref:Uncharacterized protein n=1 Tax=Mytilus galloprovincialis TaxID=29158 RepID=A0A8B6CT23_MYTGA|nr:Hypothetical predicted protein [Mytilus galloprovincialis]
MNEVEECEICGKLLTDHEAKKYKLYVSNSAVPIPRTTAFRKRKFDQETCIQSVTVSGQLDLECQEESTTFETRSETAESSSLSNLESCHSSSIHEEELAHTVSYNECTSSQNKLETGMLESISVLNEHEVLNSNSAEIHVQNVYDKTMQSFPGAWECEAAAAELSDCDSSATSISRDSDSDIDTDFESDISSSSELDTDTEDNILSDDSSFDQPEIANSESQTKLTHDEEKDMALLSLLLRYHLGESGSRDVVKILNIFNPENKVKDPNKLKACIGSTETQIYEFCDKCYTLYTEEDIFQCAIAGCNGIRYKGPINKQQLKRKKTYFTCLPVKQQIKDILQREGIWSSIVKYRADCKATTDVTDIVTGEMYRDLCKPGQFMNGKDNFTLLFNTDGVPLFKSSGVSIWPIYLVINELPPVLRFSRRNMIIWGIWQSKGKPVFRTFLQPFIEHMIDLKDNGVSISVDGKTVLTRGLLLASTMDLQAKAYLTEMTQHNGKNSCITCEDPGEVVKQGRGHTRVYPHRNDSDLYKVRNSAEILACGLAALQTNKPEMGVKGVSSLHGLEWFDMVWGLVPDYMHGVLLGVTKMLMKTLVFIITCW